jgi:uncharacterized membrane-anchored protein
MSDDNFLAVLSAAAESARIMSILNAVLAIGLMIRFRRARWSPWLWTAIASPLFVGFLTPAFQSS